MRKLLIAIILLGCALPVFALPKIAYVGMSGVLPGSGELMLGRSTRGSILMGADLITIAAFLGTGRQVDDLTRSYKRYAGVYAGAHQSTDDLYYQHIQQYDSSAAFNEYQEMMARNYFLIYYYDPAGYEEYMQANTYSADEAWDWQSDEHHSHYKHRRSSRQKAKMYNNLCLGVLILNRAVSMIDTAFISKGTRDATPVYFTPTQELGLMLNYRMEF